MAFATLTGTPTTLSGYGITDASSLSANETVAGAKTFSAPVILGGQTSDPASPSNGAIWYNATSAQHKAQIGGAAKVLQTGSEIAWLTPISGDHVMTTQFSSNAPQPVAQAANGLRLFPFAAPTDIAVRGMSILVSTAAASALTKLVIYDADANGRPNALLAESSALDCSAIGVKTAALTMTLQRGQTYWLGARHNAAVTLLASQGSATPDINGGAPVGSLRKSVSRAVTYGINAPSPWGWNAAEISATAPVAIWLQV